MPSELLMLALVEFRDAVDTIDDLPPRHRGRMLIAAADLVKELRAVKALTQ